MIDAIFILAIVYVIVRCRMPPGGFV